MGHHKTPKSYQQNAHFLLIIKHTHLPSSQESTEEEHNALGRILMELALDESKIMHKCFFLIFDSLDLLGVEPKLHLNG